MKVRIAVILEVQSRVSYWKGHQEASRALAMLFLIWVLVTYGVFIFWKFTELYTCGLYTFLYVYFNNIYPQSYHLNWIMSLSKHQELAMDSLACCSPWGRKESDTIERLNWNESNSTYAIYRKKHKWSSQQSSTYF